MTRSSLTAAVLLALLPVGIAAAYPAQTPKTKPSSKPVIPLLQGYKKWPCANPRPVYMASWLVLLCISTPAQQEEVRRQDEKEKNNPHYRKLVRVYIKGAKADKALRTQQSPEFPVGTVVVKEKLADSVIPELMTVMVKRESGYDSAGGDWEYLVVTGDGSTIQAQGKLENCRSCHIKAKANGYVFRDYLPLDLKAKMR